MSIRPQDIQIADYDYPLPDERIAKYPLPDRSSSKLLRYQVGDIEEFTFRDLPRLLPEGAVLVRNNSKVIRARLLFHKESGARIEIFCLDPAAPSSYELSLGERHHCLWHCLIGNAKRFKEGTSLTRLLYREGQGYTGRRRRHPLLLGQRCLYLRRTLRADGYPSHTALSRA